MPTTGAGIVGIGGGAGGGNIGIVGGGSDGAVTIGGIVGGIMGGAAMGGREGGDGALPQFDPPKRPPVFCPHAACAWNTTRIQKVVLVRSFAIGGCARIHPIAARERAHSGVEDTHRNPMIDTPNPGPLNALAAERRKAFWKLRCDPPRMIRFTVVAD